MKLFKAATTVCCMVMMGVVVAPNANADAWNRKTTITFSSPVEIPGVHLAGFGILPAGTYVFKILDSQSDRHIVQIFDKDETTIYATILAIPNYRLKATDKTVVTFTERPAGQPEALRAWFYPGRNWGEEFVYPKSRAMELAKASNMPVLYTPTEMPLEVSEAIKTAEAPAVVELKRAPVMAISPKGEDVQLAEVVTAPPAEEPTVTVAQAPAQTQEAPAPAQETRASTVVEKTLPATASPLPLLALLGFLALGGALSIRAFENRIS